MTADVRTGLCKTTAGNRADCSNVVVFFISCHGENKLVINREMFEELPGITVDPLNVVKDVAGLLHQSAVGITHTQSQTGNIVKQWSKLTRFLEFFKSLVDRTVRQMDLRFKY